MDNPQYTYIIQEREFVNSKEPVYKIGKTKQQNQKRFSSYPKGSVLIQQFYCYDCDNIEKQIITLFNTKYKKRPEYGNEYYEGNFEDMIEDINCFIMKEKNDNKNLKVSNDLLNEITGDFITDLFKEIMDEEKKAVVVEEPVVFVEEPVIFIEEPVVEPIITENTKGNYCCKICVFYTKLKRNYENHIITEKHLRNINKNITEQKYMCVNCNKKFLTNNGLWKHKKKCNKENTKSTNILTEENAKNFFIKNKELLKNIILN